MSRRGLERFVLVLAVAGVAVAAPRAAAQRPASVKVFFTKGEQLAAVTRAVGAGQRPEAVALRALMAGPSATERRAGLRSAIPAGSRLRSVRLLGSLVRADVHFAGEGARSGAFALSLRPARTQQVAETLRALEGIRAIELRVDGSPHAVPNAAPDRLPPTDPPDLQPIAPAPEFPYAIQDRLAELRYLPRAAVTGRWDYRTEQAVLALQSWSGIDRDGEVGPQTLGVLGEAEVPEPRRSQGKRIEVYRSRGVALLVVGGAVRRAIHVSTGAPGFETPLGSFQVFRKERFSWSVPYRLWLPHASYFTGGVAFHAHSEVPTHPASHGCVRVPYPEAPVVYAFASIGTRVLVFP
ncbi:MAG: L,D-transpeptidase family protein [Gaiellaceae bacterium]